MWVQPELTQKLYVGLLVAFISSCLLPYKLLGFIIGTNFMQYIDCMRYAVMDLSLYVMVYYHLVERYLPQAYINI